MNNITIDQFNSWEESKFYRKWYIVKRYVEENINCVSYLWPDGRWKRFCFHAKYEGSGYYDTKEEAEKILEKYQNKK